jgi:type IV secretion system protein VirB10
MTDRTQDLTAELRLRPERPPVTRLSRRVLVALSAVAIVLILAALAWGLAPRSKNPMGQELYNLDNKPEPDQLANLPCDYSGLPKQKEVPQLGPPLPGDLGRPMLAASKQSDSDEQRVAQEAEAARTSKLFIATEKQSGGFAPGNGTPVIEPKPLPAAFVPSASAPDPNLQERKLAFLNAAADHRTVSAERLESAASRYVVQAGAVIPAALITGIQSDLPGQITAQVTENVYDTPTGQYLLIPQGARLIGNYDAHVTFGQSRVLLVWTRLIMPNGQSIVLERLPGADPEGYAGLEDGVDYHWSQLFKAALLSTILGVGANLGNNSDNQIVLALRNGASNSLNQAGQQVVERQLNIQPTLTVRPGFPVRVMVNRDLMLAPYAG